MLVVDANILIRAVLGSRVLFLLRKYSEQIEFLAPDISFEEAREHLPEILVARGVPVAPAMATLDLVAGLVNTVASETYSPFEAVACQRIGFGARARLRELDRRPRLLRLRRGNLDDGPR